MQGAPAIPHSRTPAAREASHTWRPQHWMLRPPDSMVGGSWGERQGPTTPLSRGDPMESHVGLPQMSHTPPQGPRGVSVCPGPQRRPVSQFHRGLSRHQQEAHSFWTTCFPSKTHPGSRDQRELCTKEQLPCLLPRGPLPRAPQGVSRAVGPGCQTPPRSILSLGWQPG